MNRTLITLLLIGMMVGLGIFLVIQPAKDGTPVDPKTDSSIVDSANANSLETETPTTPEKPKQSDDNSVTKTTEPTTDQTPTIEPKQESTNTVASPVQPEPKIDGLMVLPCEPSAKAVVLGSDVENNPQQYRLKVRFNKLNNGISEISLPQYATQVNKDPRYIIQKWAELESANGKKDYVYPMSAYAVWINNQKVVLVNQTWQVVADQTNETQATFALTIAEAKTKKPVLRIVRTFSIVPGRYDLNIDQNLENLTDQPLQVRFSQFGQVDLPLVKGYMGDKRTVIMGYFNPGYDKKRKLVFKKDHEWSRADVISEPDYQKLWPTPMAQDKELTEPYELVYAATTNRYFVTALHKQIVRLEDNEKNAIYRGLALDKTFKVINRYPVEPAEESQMAVMLESIDMTVQPGKVAKVDLAMYVGPREPSILRKDPVYLAMGFYDLIIYSLGGCCTAFTFQPVAEFLLWMMRGFHYVLKDWALSIIVLVLIVRLVLHPITKKSQLNMMKVGKQMQALKPELDKLKKKFADNQQKLNQETMKLYREKGVNPAAMGLGCMPMFLQMPIWFALYAMLYFAIELRHQPAFYDVFHHFGNLFGWDWQFLTDLSSADKFIVWSESATLPVIGHSLNILPLLWAVTMFLQQKYFNTMPQTDVSDQQKQQQKMMKFMTLIFPFMLYQMPAGLILYILASTCAGMIDSHIVRKHLKELEATGKLFEKKPANPNGFMARMQKTMAERQKQMQQTQQQQDKKRSGGKGSGKRR